MTQGGTRPRFLALLSAALLTGLLATASAGCFTSTDPGPEPTSNWAISDARMFDAFPLYWLGESYQGMPLTTRITRDGDDVIHASFAYGEQALAQGSHGKFWVPRFEVNIQPYCGYSPQEYLSYDSDTKPVSVEIRGVNGYLKRYSKNEASLELWTGGSAIYLRTWKSSLDVEEAARALIPIADELGATLRPLPAPITAVCDF